MEMCEYLESCPFYLGTMSRRSDNIESLKQEYCRKSPLRCARHMIIEALGEERVPEELFPDEKMTAYGLIAENG